MTNAVATSTSAKQTVPHAVPVVLLGTDAVLAALPATAIQLAHACIEAGFVNVIPASWGDELIAAATLRRLPEFGDGPVIHCSCPIVAHRLLSVSGDLRPVLLPLVPPPVALARYVRALSKPNRARVTYVGGCPGATDESIDIRMTPDALLSMLAERGIDIAEQPRVFESFIPADRRRFLSQPGGLPTADALWSDHGSRSLVEVAGEDLAAEIAQHVLGGRNVLIDAAMKLGCVCSGATAHAPTRDAREFLASLEPPRATTPVVDENTRIELDLQVPAAPRTPLDIMAVPSASAANGSTARAWRELITAARRGYDSRHATIAAQFFSRHSCRRRKRRRRSTDGRQRREGASSYLRRAPASVAAEYACHSRRTALGERARGDARAGAGGVDRANGNRAVRAGCLRLRRASFVPGDTGDGVGGYGQIAARRTASRSAGLERD